MSPFSLQAMRDYMPKMVDIAEQLMDKWSRLNPGEEVDVPADMTRLTLDTIALCGFGYRFNSFYRDTPHPFVEAMVRTLAEAQARTRQLPIQTRLKIRAQRRVEEDQAFMNGLVDRLIAERRAQGDAADTTDLLGRMLSGVDKASGQGLPDSNIRAQCITFLIAGHETTSGLLSFAVYYLLKDPAVLARARAEADAVLGSDAWPTFEQVHRLTYIRQVLDESLRLWPTAPGFSRYPYEDTVIGGRYAIPAHTPITVLTPALHRDPAVWGPDAAEFNPEHVAPERLATISPNVYKPFGTGQRACIGRQFALQEAMLVLGMLLQRFDLVDHRNYQLRTKTTLTVKPDDFHIQVRPRPDVRLERAGAAPSRQPGRPPPPTATRRPRRPGVLVARHGTPLLVLFGSNLGTAESIAARLAREGTERGFDVTLARARRPGRRAAGPRRGPRRLLVLQRHPSRQRCRVLPVDQRSPGRRPPPVSPTRCSAAATPSGPRRTRRCPTLIDAQLAAHGAHRVHPRGEGNAAADFDAAYRAWHADLWATWRRRWTCRPRSRRSAPVAPALDHADQPAADQPGDRVLRGAPGPGPAEPAS